MSGVGFLAVTLMAMLPLFALLLRRPARTASAVTARGSALTLYREQLHDLERDRDAGLIDESERARAELEIQRRILSADSMTEHAMAPQGDRKRLLGLLALLPAFGFALYLVNGHPSLPPQPHGSAHSAVSPEMLRLFDKLARQVASMSPDDPDYVRQSILLGQVDEHLDRIDNAIHAYRQALAVRFIPELALQIAELQTQRDGHISADSLALYRRALDAAPADAPWRLAVEARIASGEHDQAH
ncbi:c-type cytochrome biogenesis protein CcmI [Asaia krungthepensis]|uniref:Cytochrome c-type biogenesis protein CycH n=1 Tax=Asaia krungthepensis NRIC 0535 TaxID=1307925 RepID=A0ABQ0Q673_9PROT|nr:c-type cytochrome biogenesis protein CcmI [Asaia krungthepensis]GBQ93272.1 cytochrome c-type biogenesis protein CycH [Asaia krungthepensis NRIC 0535]